MINEPLPDKIAYTEATGFWHFTCGECGKFSRQVTEARAKKALRDHKRRNHK